MIYHNIGIVILIISKILYLQSFIFNWITNQSLVPDSFKTHLLLYKQNHFWLSQQDLQYCLALSPDFLCAFHSLVIFKEANMRILFIVFKRVIRHWNFHSMHCMSLHLLYSFYIIIHTAQSIWGITDTVLVLFLLV